MAWIEQNRALVSHALTPLLARYPDLSEADKGDVTAAGLRALCEAVDKFDPNAGVKLSTYAYKLIEFAGRKALSLRGNWKATRAGVAVSSLDAPIEAGDGTTARGDMVADARAVESFAQVLDVADECERAEALWAWIKATVTPRQACVLRLCFIEGKTGKEAAEALGKSHQCVSLRLQGGLAALRKAADTVSGRQMARRLFRAE